MDIQRLNWKSIFTYGGILLICLLVLIVLPLPISALLFGVVSIGAIGLGVWAKAAKALPFRVPLLEGSPARSLPVRTTDAARVALPAAQADQPVSEVSALKSITRFRIYKLHIDINVQDPLDPETQSLVRAWSFLLPKLKFAPFLVGIIVFALFVRNFIPDIAGLTNGHFTYTLDDSYIQMAMAKNLALHGMWGITPYSFSSSSSSPLWVVVLSSVYRVLGVQESTPLILNLIMAVLLFAFIAYSLQRRGVAPLYVVLVPLALIFTTQLFATLFTGMEHIMHTLLVLIFLHLALDLFAEEQVSPRRLLLTGVAAGLMVAARYESVFILGLTCGLLVLQERFRRAFVVGLGGALPLGIYGLISSANGWHFLPNSLILKTDPVVIDSLSKVIDLIYTSVRVMLQKPELTLLFVVMLVVLMVRQHLRPAFWKDRPSIALFLITFSILIQRALMPYGSFNRYDFYEYVVAYYALALALYDVAPRSIFQFRLQRFPTYAAFTVFLLVFLFTGYMTGTQDDAWQMGGAARNIYAQQYQMGSFVHRYYDDSVVALNDIGAVSFLSDARIADLWGLGSIEPANAKLTGTYGPDFIASYTLAQDVRLAIIYQSWFRDAIPPGWVAVGTWEINDGIIVGDTKVTFYATHESDAPALAAHLQEYAPNLLSDTTPTLLYPPSVAS